MPEVAIEGGGLIGLACALELAGRGVRVALFDPRRRGQASWAAAGILAPQSETPSPSPMLDLCRASFDLYPAFVAGLAAEVGFRQNGTLHRAFDDEEREKLRAQAQWQKRAGLRVEERDRDTFFFPDEGQVDNRKLLLALEAACRARGVAFSDAPAGEGSGPTVLCSGAWTKELGVFPVKGEMLALDAKPPAQVVFGGGGYLVPRGGLTLVGATVEPMQSDPTPTARGRAFLLGIAARHGYAGAAVVDHWAGLRPGTPDGLPLLGRVAGGRIVATGHYRNGVLLAPVTAKIAAALALGEAPPSDLAPFDPLRYAGSPSGRHA